MIVQGQPVFVPGGRAGIVRALVPVMSLPNAPVGVIVEVVGRVDVDALSWHEGVSFNVEVFWEWEVRPAWA